MSYTSVAGLFAGGVTVSVTGGAGFIGSWLVKRLLTLNNTVVVLDDLSSGSHPPEPTPRLRFVRGSVLDPHALDDATGGAEVLIHLAGVVGMRLATLDRQRALQLSVEGTELLLGRTPEIPTVLVSSSSVYGLAPVNPVKESMGGCEEQAIDYDGGLPGYATGKCRMEALGRRAARPVLCVRPFNVVGPGQVSTWGMVLPSFVERACTGEQLVVYNDGHQSRSFTFVGSFTEALLRAMATPATWQLPDRALNVGAAAATTILDLARLVIARVKSASTIVNIPYETVFPHRRDVTARTPNTARLTSLIGPVEWPSIEQIVDIVIDGRQR